MIAAIASVIVMGVAIYAFTAYNGPTYVTQTYFPMDIDKLAKQSDIIVIGTVGDVISSSVNRTDKIAHLITRVNVNVEQIVAGTFSDKEIPVSLLGDGKTIIYEDEVKLEKGERVLLFLTHTGTDTVYGDAYVPIGGSQAKFSIGSDDVARNPIHGEFPVQELIDRIVAARSAN